ncbi:MAG TPA: NUDIX hydrolase [Pseudomonas xinjiangensis]|uniref:Phosphatase NudJ n=2 Tax=root TaxID=1 RepID=A0A7V1BM12_9GAMM|nr:NUDIX hydrolase [Halopseudomonas xinjiangensis]HEC47740.1 NUDIX hydrolase [Halopseudomonas xinjiangensis]
MRFLPHVTVATIVEDQGRFLMVEERRDGRTVLNQPAGHLEADESLIQAARREVLEETAWTVDITSVVGIYLLKADNGVTYQRTCFAGRALEHHPDLPLDDGILGARWMTLEQLQVSRVDLRSYLVLECILDYLHKPHYPLDLIR